MGFIRLLLALSVVIDHSAQRHLFGFVLVAGQAAVQAFYVISGFYMALVLCRKYAPGASGYRTFLAARVMRLMPAYLAVLALAIALPAAKVLFHPAYERWQNDFSGMSPAAVALYGGTQLSILGQDAVWFTRYDPTTGGVRPDAVNPDSVTVAGERAIDPAAPVVDPSTPRDGMDFLLVPQAWTLAVELAFYCVAPFIVRRLGTIGLFLALSVACRLALAQFGLSKGPWSYRFFPSELGFFLLGSAGYHAFAWLERNRPTLLRRGGYVALPAMASLILFLFLFELPLRALTIIVSMGVTLPFIFAMTKRNRVDRWIGELSYPIYISHELVRLALIHHVGEAGVVTLIATTLVASVALMMLVEQPFDYVRSRFVARRIARERRDESLPLAPPQQPEPVRIAA